MGDEGPVLIDFGIAQVLDATRMTQTGTFLGTPGYAAPELFAGEQVGEPADLHAWAATVAFAATGRPTFGGGSAESQMYAILHGKADLKDVPPALLPQIEAAFNRDPAERPTAAILADRMTRLARAAEEHDVREKEAEAAEERPRQSPASLTGAGTPGPGRSPARADRGGSGWRQGQIGQRGGDQRDSVATPTAAAAGRRQAEGGRGLGRGFGSAEGGRRSRDSVGRGSGSARLMVAAERGIPAAVARFPIRPMVRRGRGICGGRGSGSGSAEGGRGSRMPKRPWFGVPGRLTVGRARGFRAAQVPARPTGRTRRVRDSRPGVRFEVRPTAEPVRGTPVAGTRGSESVGRAGRRGGRPVAL